MPDRRWTAFRNETRIATGSPHDVVTTVKTEGEDGVLVFDDATGKPVDLDLRGSLDECLQRVARHPEEPVIRKPGRPKLGVVPREVTLLPRHWEWLARQPGGASVALRKLVDEARRVHGEKDRRREAQSAAYRFLSALAGNERGFEEAARALFAGNRERFSEVTAAWPHDIRDHAVRLALAAFAERPAEAASH